ncbi:hypothetical protein HYT57_00930 [Candidatus Woesearchaeota archaeon]|nr:hypothetical protein [Candidatus Woesearchaeota archaeon]
MKNKKLGLSTLAVAAALGFFSPNQAKAEEEVFSDTVRVAPVTITTDRVREDSLDVKEDKPGSLQYYGTLDSQKADTSKEAIGIPKETKQVQPKKRDNVKKRFGTIIGFAGGVYDNSENYYTGSGAGIGAGAEIRVLGPLYLHGQFVGIFGEPKDQGNLHKLVDLKSGLEAKIPIFGDSGINLIFGKGVTTYSTGNKDLDGKGTYSQYGIEAGPIQGTNLHIRYGLDRSNVRDRLNKKSKGIFVFLQLTGKY